MAHEIILLIRIREEMVRMKTGTLTILTGGFHRFPQSLLENLGQ
jgi:hypothetical protein